MRWYFAMRRIVDAGELSRLPVADIDRFRTLRSRLTIPPVEALYLVWLKDGDRAFTSQQTSAAHSAAMSFGHLEAEGLPFEYSQFGSLPGVA